MMFVKRSLIVLVALVFTLSMTAFSFAAEGAKGTVTKIQDTQITIQSAIGQEETIEIADPDILKNLKVGDRIAMHDGMLVKKITPSSAHK